MDSHHANSEEVALLIHGTGAQDPDQHNEGSRWWQVGSDFSSRLNGLLVNSNVNVNKEVFHWSGENSEAEREQAGRDLYWNWIRRYEREGQPYHLIGHSHGGSVIWDALQRAARRGDELRNLKSWATVGTPFIHYRWRLGPAAVLILLIKVAIVSAAVLATLYVLYFLAAPALGVVSEIKFDIDTFSNKIIFFVFLAAFLGTLGWATFVTLEPSLRLRRRSSIVQETVRLFGDRWMGLFSKYDEAIHGLRRTTEITDSSGVALFPRVAWARTRMRNIRLAGPFWQFLPRLLLLLLLTSGSVFPISGLVKSLGLEEVAAGNIEMATKGGYGLLFLLVAAYAMVTIRSIRDFGQFLPWLLLIVGWGLLLIFGLNAFPVEEGGLASAIFWALLSAYFLLVVFAAGYALLTPGYNLLSRWTSASRAPYWPILCLLGLGAPAVLVTVGILLLAPDKGPPATATMGIVVFWTGIGLPILFVAVSVTYVVLVVSYNGMVAFFDRCFVDMVGRKLQGNDVYTTAEAGEVSKGPMLSREFPSLPVEVDNYLKKRPTGS